jgi:hypothetical protein
MVAPIRPEVRDRMLKLATREEVDEFEQLLALRFETDPSISLALALDPDQQKRLQELGAKLQPALTTKSHGGAISPIPNIDLDDLLIDPREAIDIEIKTWLDLSKNDCRAAVAKEIIALANSGGGFLLIGFDESPQGQFTSARVRPASLDAWSQDGIQSIISKYCEPSFQCRVLHHAVGGGHSYPVIIVPGGHHVPIMAKAGAPDGKTLVSNRVYIRRPGPSSEEPKTADEWRQLLDRLVQNRRSDLIEVVRTILGGAMPREAKASSRTDDLDFFMRNSIHRWEGRVAKLPDAAPPRFPHGFYEIGFAIDGDFERQNLSILQRTIAEAVRNHSGWPPFLTLTRKPFKPKAVDGAIEFWRGPDLDGSFDAPAHHDFWRAASEGLLYTRRGYQEDGRLYEMPPGQFFDITTPTWRTGEAILEAYYIATALRATDAKLICRCRWTGLNERILISKGNPNRHLSPADRKCEQSEFETVRTIGLSTLPLALPEFVHGILAPLYELFDFFQLPERLVVEELAALQHRRFNS